MFKQFNDLRGGAIFPETLRIFFLCRGMMTSHEEFQSLKKGKTIKEIASWRI